MCPTFGSIHSLGYVCSVLQDNWDDDEEEEQKKKEEEEKKTGVGFGLVIWVS